MELAEAQLKKEENCRVEVAESYYKKAIAYWSGVGEKFDRTECKVWFEKATENGHRLAPIWLTLYWSDFSQGHDINCTESKKWEKIVIQRKSIELLKEQVNQGKPISSAFLLGYLYQEGTIVNKDISKAKKYYEIAAADEFLPALNNLGTLYLLAIGSHNDLSDGLMVSEKSLYYIGKASAKGYAPAQYNLAIHYYEKAIDLDEQKFFNPAIDLLKLSAEQNYPNAQNLLACMYSDGDGVPCNPTLATEWFLKAANNGYICAQYSLGLRYHHGLTDHSKTPNYKEAFYWFHKAATKGDRESMAMTGFYYLYGYYVIIYSHFRLPVSFFYSFPLFLLSPFNSPNIFPIFR